MPLPPKEEAKPHVILNDSEESHNLSEEYILRTFSVGYFADAQFDVLFLLVFASVAKQTPGRVKVYGV